VTKENHFQNTLLKDTIEFTLQREPWLTENIWSSVGWLFWEFRLSWSMLGWFW
jgi:hypothetical protein